jgi:hypothetical protein
MDANYQSLGDGSGAEIPRILASASGGRFIPAFNLATRPVIQACLLRFSHNALSLDQTGQHGPFSCFSELSFSRLVQPPVSSWRVEAADQFTGKFVNLLALEIVGLLPIEVIN